MPLSLATVAHHEAGHAVAYAVAGIRFERVRVEPSPDYDGWRGVVEGLQTDAIVTELNKAKTVSMELLVGFMAGYRSQCLLTGDEELGGSDCFGRCPQEKMCDACAVRHYLLYSRQYLRRLEPDRHYSRDDASKVVRNMARERSVALVESNAPAIRSVAAKLIAEHEADEAFVLREVAAGETG